MKLVEIISPERKRWDMLLTFGEIPSEKRRWNNLLSTAAHQGPFTKDEDAKITSLFSSLSTPQDVYREWVQLVAVEHRSLQRLREAGEVSPSERSFWPRSQQQLQERNKTVTALNTALAKCELYSKANKPHISARQNLLGKHGILHSIHDNSLKGYGVFDAPPGKQLGAKQEGPNFSREILWVLLLD